MKKKKSGTSDHKRAAGAETVETMAPLSNDTGEVSPQLVANNIGGRLGRLLSACSLLFCLAIYLALFRHASFPVLAGQVFIWFLAWLGRRWPLYFLAALLPFFAHQPGTFHGQYFVEMTLLLLIIRWLWTRWRAGDGPFVYTPITPWLLLFVGFSVISFLPLAGAQWRHYAWVGNQATRPWSAANVLGVYRSSPFMALWPLHALWDMLVSSLFFFYMADSFRSRRQRLWLLAALALGVLWSVVLGFLADWGLLSLDWLRPTWEHGYRTFRFQSVATNSGWYAMWLVLILPFLAGAAFFPGTGLGRGWRWMARAVFILGAAALFFTVARGGWLAGLLGCGLTSGLALRAWLRDKGFRRRGWMTAGACVLVLLILVGGLAIAAKHDRRIGIRLQTLLDASGRVDIWRVSLRLWRERPLLGVGLGNYYQSTLTLPPRESFKDGKAKGTAHNTYLHVLTERGPFALAALLTIVLVAAWRVGKRPSERRDAGRVDWWMASALGMFTAWLVYGTVQYMFVLRLHDLSFWALTALALGEAGLCGASRSGLVLAGKDIREEQRRKLLWADWRQRFGGAGGAKNALNWKIVARMTAWLASPMAVFLELSLALSPLLSKGATNASAFVEKFELERGGWFLFALAGFAPLALGVSLILDTWLRPGLRMGSALVHNLARYGLFAALFYGVAAVFYFQERGVPDFGSRSMALFFIGLVLTMNQGLLIGKFYRSRSPRLLSPKPDGVSVPLVARLRPYLMGLVFLAAAPVFYSWAATPFWIKALCLWNPILPGVRVSQILLMGEPVSLWPWMLLLVAWNSILPFVDAGERLKSIVKARRSLQRGMTA